MNNTLSFPSVCPFCNLFTAATSESLDIHQRESNCMAIYVAQQFNQVEESSELNVFLSDNMDEAASGAGTPASEMGVSVGGEGLSLCFHWPN